MKNKNQRSMDARFNFLGQFNDGSHLTNTAEQQAEMSLCSLTSPAQGLEGMGSELGKTEGGALAGSSLRLKTQNVTYFKD